MANTGWLAVVYQQYRRELYATAWAVLRRTDLAEDAVQAAFVKLVKLNAKPSDTKLYVFRCVRNAAIDLAKVRGRLREEPLPSDFDWAKPESELTDAHSWPSIADLLERLDDPSREVIELHLHAGLTFQEIGEMLEEPLPTVASRYRRALDKLANEMKVGNG